MAEEGIVVYHVDAVSVGGGAVQCSNMQGPGSVSDSEDRCLDFVGLIGGCFEVL